MNWIPFLLYIYPAGIMLACMGVVLYAEDKAQANPLRVGALIVLWPFSLLLFAFSLVRYLINACRATP
jgi:hypothetical protein